MEGVRDGGCYYCGLYKVQTEKEGTGRLAGTFAFLVAAVQQSVYRSSKQETVDSCSRKECVAH